MKDTTAFKWLYSTLSSLKTSVYVLAAMTVFYITGTVFPQGADIGDYVTQGGKFADAVRLFNLLDIFNTPLFYLAVFILTLNAGVCLYDRFFKLIERKDARADVFTPDFTVALKTGKEDAEYELSKFLKKDLGFRLSYAGQALMVFEKGIYYKWLTWLYHAAIILCVLGFVLSGLFMKEGTITLKPGRPEKIPEPEKLGWLAKKDTPDFKLLLDEFSTEYAETPETDYPKDKLSRLSIALGWKGISYELKDDSLFPKDWFSKLKVLRGKETFSAKTIEVNDPLTFEGYTFYQLGFEQKLKIKADDKTYEVKAGETLDAATAGRFKFGLLRTGKLYRFDGTVTRIEPFVMVKKAAPNANDFKAAPAMKLKLNGHVDAGNGKRLEFTGFEESSVLSYRYDPGTNLLWIAGAVVFIVMTIRCFWRWYLLSCRIETIDGAVALAFSIKGKGLMANTEKIKERILSRFASPARD